MTVRLQCVFVPPPIAEGLRVWLHRVVDEGGAPAVAPLATAAERSLRSGFGAERFLLVVARWPD